MKLIPKNFRSLFVSSCVALLIASINLGGCVSTDSPEDAAGPETNQAENSNSTNEASGSEANNASTNVANPGNAVEGSQTPAAEGTTVAAATANSSQPPTEELNNLVQNGASETAGGTPTANTQGLDNTAGEDPFAPAPGNNAQASSPTPQEGVVSQEVTQNNGNAAEGATPGNTNAKPQNALASTNTSQNKAATPAAEVTEEKSAPLPDAPQTAAEDEAAPAKSAPIPENGSKMPYFIKSGDTLAIIANKIYGNNKKWKELAQINNLQNAALIYPGDVIFYTVNEKSRAFAEKYEGTERKTVTVAAGDTLYSIAAKVLKNAGEWKTLWKENAQISHPDKIRVGMVLTYRSHAEVAEIKKAISPEQDDEESEVASIDDEDSLEVDHLFSSLNQQGFEV